MAIQVLQSQPESMYGAFSRQKQVGGTGSKLTRKVTFGATSKNKNSSALTQHLDSEVATSQVPVTMVPRVSLKKNPGCEMAKAATIVRRKNITQAPSLENGPIAKTFYRRQIS